MSELEHLDSNAPREEQRDEPIGPLAPAPSASGGERITGVLREWREERYSMDKRLLAIADRIDATHKKALRIAYAKGREDGMGAADAKDAMRGAGRDGAPDTHQERVATDELRIELAKRGVKYEVDDGKTVRVTRWKAYGEWVSFIEYDTGETRFCADMRRLTPMQAIAATLGRGMFTAEQAREVRDIVDRNWHDLADEYGMGPYWSSAHPEDDYDWHAIADDLNELLGAVVPPEEDEVPPPF